MRGCQWLVMHRACCKTWNWRQAHRAAPRNKGPTMIDPHFVVLRVPISSPGKCSCDLWSTCFGSIEATPCSWPPDLEWATNAAVFALLAMWDDCSWNFWGDSTTGASGQGLPMLWKAICWGLLCLSANMFVNLVWANNFRKHFWRNISRHVLLTW